MTCRIANDPRLSNTIESPLDALGGNSFLVSGVSASLPLVAIKPVSVCVACGSYRLRTGEFAPSAPTSRSAVAVVPSTKYAVTVPSSLVT